MRAWRNAAAYDPRRGAVATWVLTIARNVAIDTARIRRSEPMDPEAMLALEQPSAEDGDERMIAFEETERLRKAMATLPPEQRRALILAAFFGHTAVEISEHEQAPVGTIKTRIRTAMIKLRSQLRVADER